ncbi:MAG: Uncharacterized protein JWN76_497 [Chitinophagaceae bacterium]|nr:Uncharacterized protein [Chitinophagaceae bacterium]
MSAEKFFEHYKSNGYNFSKSVLSRYCLSLYTKPFVILSGISGNGKTKIAQLFQTFDDESAASQSAPLDDAISLTGYIILNVTEGIRNADGRGNLKFSDLNAVFEASDIPAIEEKINKLREEGGDDNITELSAY